jgi:hypothetical protein
MYKIIIPIITLGFFCMLCGYAEGRRNAPVVKVSEHYGQEVILKRDNGTVWNSQRRAAAIKEIFHIEDLNKATNIWGEQ